MSERTWKLTTKAGTRAYPRRTRGAYVAAPKLDGELNRQQRRESRAHFRAKATRIRIQQRWFAGFSAYRAQRKAIRALKAASAKAPVRS